MSLWDESSWAIFNLFWKNPIWPPYAENSLSLALFLNTVSKDQTKDCVQTLCLNQSTANPSSPICIHVHIFSSFYSIVNFIHQMSFSLLVYISFTFFSIPYKHYMLLLLYTLKGYMTMFVFLWFIFKKQMRYSFVSQWIPYFELVVAIIW